MSALSTTDPDVARAARAELERQRNSLELIPSENFTSLAVLEAIGSVLTNKYAEGYPGKRYYGGCENVDTVEALAIERARALFGADHANVQPLSGAPANLAAYAALLQPGDTVLGMDLSHGGHLTHGHPVTETAKRYRFLRYKTNPQTGAIDYDALAGLAREHHPKLILAGFSAYSRSVDWQRIKEIADTVGARTMADIAHVAGLIAGGALESPVPFFDVVTMTTHKTLRGPRGGLILCRKAFAAAVDKAVFPGLQGGPHMNLVAGKAVALREAQGPAFRDYAQQVLKNAKALEGVFHVNGIRICFNRTDNHLLLLDVTSRGLTGGQAETLLNAVGITVNKNAIPDDPRPPRDPSGIRLGSPALTTRGLREPEFERIGQAIVDVLKHPDDSSIADRTRQTVRELTAAFPLYPELD